MGANDRDRFTRLAREHTPAIANYLRRRLYPLTPADLDDLVEETLIVVWKRLDDVPVDAELPWMLGVARNILRNARRSSSRRTSFEDTLRPRDDEHSAEEYVVADIVVRNALSSLSNDDREILLLHAWDGLGIEELGRFLLISPNAAAVRLSRSQRRFRDFLDRAEIA